ncbi:MAG TPA: 3'-5' exonuclease [Flavitalea sp.]|nr:3'-5' exonuclease [Flavitalea sp.]
MKLLFFDIETNGLPIDYKASYTEVENWPRVISLGWILADMDARVINKQYHLIKPDGWQMPTEQFWVDNGYTQENSLANGVPIADVLDLFLADKHQADVLVAHNLNFDHRIVWAEHIRAGKEPRSGMAKICTMMKSTSFCKIPGANGRPKWPKLEELYHKLFNKSFAGAHNALADVEACAECFYELVRLGVITIEAQPVE